jgi:hypothetical protein
MTPAASPAAAFGIGKTDPLSEMYESLELFNEGLMSFEYPLFKATDEELDYFLGGLAKKLKHAARGIAKAAKSAGVVVSAVEKFPPASLVASGLAHTPVGMAAKAGLGAVSAAVQGKNVFQGAVRAIASDPALRFLVDTGMAAAKGKNLLRAARDAAKAGISDLRESLRFAAMVAPLVPGAGSGVAAALGAANALASGQPITKALMAAARDALPGGAIAQSAFDVATDLAKGRNLGQAALNAARAQLPGGAAAQAAFDAGLALAHGKNLQSAAFTAAGKLLPPSPYAADALSFARKVAAGKNIQKAALSSTGNYLLNRIGATAKTSGPSREMQETEFRIPALPHGRWVRQGRNIILTLPYEEF